MSRAEWPQPVIDRTWYEKTNIGYTGLLNNRIEMALNQICLLIFHFNKYNDENANKKT